MPLPKPNENEIKKEFLDRCMRDRNMKKEFPDSDQRFAVCNDIYREEKNMSECDKNKDMAEWTTKFINNLPDSSFAYIVPGGEKDSDGKTKPRSLRKLPYKNEEGKIDLPHLRNALARLSQTKDIPEEKKAAIKKKLKKELEKVSNGEKRSKEIKNAEGKYRTVIELGGIEIVNKKSWNQIMKTGDFKHHIFGEFKIIEDNLMRFKDNFENNVRRIELAVDYSHKNGDKAAGWFRQLEIRKNVSNPQVSELWALIEWTLEGSKAIATKEFQYFSPEFTFEYEDSETGDKFQDVLLGGGLTNRPFLKEMQPLALSEELAVELNFENERSEDSMTEEKKLDEQQKPEEKEEVKEEVKEEAAPVEENKELSENDINHKLHEENVKLAEQVKVLKDRIDAKEFDDVYSNLISQGKVVPAMKDSYKAKFSAKELSEFAKDLPKIMDFSEKGNPDSKGRLDVELSEYADKLVKDKGISLKDAYKIAMKEKGVSF